MKTRTYTQKDGTIWEWEETAELVKLLNEIHSKKDNDGTTTN